MTYPTNKSSNAREVSLTLGDPSGDGHCQTETVHFLTAASDKELLAAYTESEALFGFAIRYVAAEYEDATIKSDQLAKFRFLGFAETLEHEHEAEDPDDSITLDTDDYALLFAFFINKSLPEAKRLVRKPGTTTELTNIVGAHGYGLFYN